MANQKMANDYLENSIQDFRERLYMLSSAMRDFDAVKHGLNQVFEKLDDGISKEYYKNPEVAKYVAEEIDAQLRLVIVAFNALNDEMKTNVTRMDELSDIIRALMNDSENTPVEA